MREGRCSGVLPLLGVGLAAWVVPMSALADSVETPYFRATSVSDLEILDETKVRVLGPGAGPFDVRFELLDDWFYEDGSASPRDERLVDLTIFRKILRTDEEQAEISLWYPTNPHLRTATIEAKDFPKHHLYLYPSPEKSGVSLSETVPAWTIKERARHKSTGFVPLAVKDLKTDMVSAPAVESGVYPHGEYECTYSTSWSWPECAYGECYAQASATTVNEVHALSLEQGEASDGYRALGEKDWNIAYIGLDRTSHSTPLKVSRKVKAKIVDQFEGATEYEWRVGPDCVSMGANNAEEFEFGVEDVSKATPSKELMDQQLSCKATIFGCHDDCRAEATVVTNFTIVAVDVTIDMADCEKSEGEEYPCEAAEKIEETQGAFIHYEDDHGMEPFSPRGSNALTRVWFSVMPDNMPNDDKIHLSFPEKALWEGAQSRGKMVYTPAKPEYTVGELKDKIFFLHGHEPSETICDHEITIEHEKSGAKDRAKYTVVELDLVPDFDRDHKIDKNDEKKVVQQKTFYWWLNDDADEGDCANCFKDHGTELPGNPQGNFTDSEINGHTDLLDFFPMWLNEKQALDLVKDRKEIVIRFHARGVGYAMTRLECTEAGDFLTNDSVSVRESVWFMNDDLEEANIHRGENIEMPEYFTRQYKEGGRKKGILIMEGGEKGVDKAKVQISLVKKTQSGEVELLTVPFQCSFRNVLEMMDRYDITESTPVENLCTIKDKEYQKGKYRIFSLHGFKVSKTLAQGWDAEFFKRLYQSGSTARFTGITWPGIIASDHPGLHYHRCAYNALNQAERLAAYIKSRATKETTVVMAHSLGNMLVSEAIQEYGLQVSSYFMLNGAIASEAFDSSKFNASPAKEMLVPWDWDEYPVESYSAYWHKLYEDDANPAAQSRAQVKWIGKFSKVLDTNACANFVNCMSSGDEVFDLVENVRNTSGLKPGCYFESMSLDDLDLSQYCWQKQEVGKGVVCKGNLLEDSDEGGWGYNTTDQQGSHAAQHLSDARMYDGASLGALVKQNGYREMLRAMPAFNPSPQEVFCWNTTNPESNRVISRNVRNHLLACAIPAISTAMGKTKGFENGVKTMDMDEKRGGGWGRGLLDAGYFSYGERWLHCDVKDMAYFYTEPLWKSIVESGNLKEEK